MIESSTLLYIDVKIYSDVLFRVAEFRYAKFRHMLLSYLEMAPC